MLYLYVVYCGDYGNEIMRLNDNVIERAKNYARSHRISLSKIIESYLDSITKQKEEEEKKISITPLVERAV